MSSPAETNVELVTLVRKIPELRMPIMKAYSLGYDSGWCDLRRRADFVIAALVALVLVTLLMLLHLAGLF
jgi:hypothetical protein